MRFLSKEGKERLHRQIESEFACEHSLSAVVVLIAKNNHPHFRRQCLNCGRRLGNIKHAELSQEEMKNAPRIDESLESNFWKRRSVRYSELEKQMLHEENQEFDREYEAYRKTEKWQRLRGKVLARDKFICQGCGSANRAIDVHHLTYDRFKDEMLFDLIAVCRDCHTRLHPEHADQPDRGYDEDDESAEFEEE
jgi:5-methylcytosine-specific restriction endonuclease McrA